MDIQLALQAISTVGFPIVCCGALLWMNYKGDEKHEKEIKYISDTLTEALNRNTVVIEHLSTLMERKGEEE